MDSNPYASPLSEPEFELDLEPEPDPLAALTERAIVPRYFAALFDYVVAGACSVLVAVQFGDVGTVFSAALVTTFLGYYFLFEGFLKRTPGKAIAGVTVVQLDGSHCTTRHVLIRTIYRAIEANPLLFGGFPAAIAVLGTKYRQRLGDKHAGTVVILTRSTFPNSSS